MLYPVLTFRSMRIFNKILDFGVCFLYNSGYVVYKYYGGYYLYADSYSKCTDSADSFPISEDLKPSDSDSRYSINNIAIFIASSNIFFV